MIVIEHQHMKDAVEHVKLIMIAQVLNHVISI